MKNKIILTTVVLCLFAGFLPISEARAVDETISIESQLNINELDFGVVNANELWLKSEEELYYTQNAGEEWRDISPKTALVEPYLLASFPRSDLGFALYLTQTETIKALEIYKTSSKGQSWKKVEGNLLSLIGSLYPDPIGSIQMQWLDENSGYILVKQVTSSNFSMGTLFITKDGGKNWETQGVPVAEEFVFLDSKLGFMRNPENKQSFYRTLDGGLSWELFDAGMLSFSTSIEIEVDLPILSQSKTALIPVKIAPEGGFSSEYLIQTTQLGEVATQFDLDKAEFAAIEKPDLQQQISKIHSPNGVALWLEMSDGNCESLGMEDGKELITCQSSFEIVYSLDGLSNWQTLKLPGGATVLKQTVQSEFEVAEANLPENAIQAQQIVQKFKGHAFDICTVPSLSKLNTWYEKSPYRVVNLYIGGISRFCTNTALDADYVKAIAKQGWKLIPTWVGHQAPKPCGNYKNPFPINVDQAYQYGVDNANQAQAKMKELGLTYLNGKGGIIYLDLEHFSYSASCSAAARAYVNGWTTRLAQLGIMSGLYATSSGLKDNQMHTISKMPAVVWIAEWYSAPGFRPNETVWGLRYLSDGLWTDYQRILQYSGGHDETWGGVRLNMDSNVAEGKVAVLAQPGDFSDIASPITEAKLIGTIGYEGWYKTAVKVELTATDDASGVRGIYYRDLDGVWNPYLAPISINGSRNVNVFYRSVDHAGNWEEPKVISFKVDTVAPTTPLLVRVGCKAYDSVPQPWCNNAYFVWDGSTDTGTGLPVSNQYQFYWGTDPKGTSSNFAPGRWFDPSPVPVKKPHYLRVRVQDNNENWSAWKTLFTLIYDPTIKGIVRLNIVMKK